MILQVAMLQTQIIQVTGHYNNIGTAVKEYNTRTEGSQFYTTQSLPLDKEKTETVSTDPHTKRTNPKELLYPGTKNRVP